MPTCRWNPRTVVSKPQARKKAAWGLLQGEDLLLPGLRILKLPFGLKEHLQKLLLVLVTVFAFADSIPNFLHFGVLGKAPGPFKFLPERFSLVPGKCARERVEVLSF